MLEKTSKGQPVLLPCKITTKIIWSEDSETRILEHLQGLKTHCFSQHLLQGLSPIMAEWNFYLIRVNASILSGFPVQVCYTWCVLSIHSALSNWCCVSSDQVFTDDSNISCSPSLPLLSRKFASAFALSVLCSSPAISVGLCCTHSNTYLSFFFLCCVATTLYI